MLYNIDTLINNVQSDVAYTWKFTLQDSQGVVFDITGASLYFIAQLDTDSSINFRNSMVTIAPALGTCYYTVNPNDFSVPGTYNAQIEVNYDSGAEVITFTGITINVAQKLPI